MAAWNEPSDCQSTGTWLGVNVQTHQHTSVNGMNRLTITLSATRYRALKEASASRGKPIGQLIDESLEFYGIKTKDEASDIVRRARARSGLTGEQAMELANKQVRQSRAK